MLMAILSFFVLIVYIFDSTAALLLANVLLPALFLASLGIGFYKIVKRDRILLLTPVGNLLLTSLLVFGFGPLIMIFGPDSVRTEIEQTFFVQDFDLFKAHATNAVGLLLVFFFFSAGLRFIRLRVAPLVERSSDAVRSAAEKKMVLGVFRISQVKAGALLLLAVSVPVRIMFITTGEDLLEPLPGFLDVFRKSGWLGLILLAILSRRIGGAYWIFLSLLLALEVTSGALTLMRGEMLTPIALVGMGLVIGGGSVWLLPVFGAVCFGLFFVAKPIIDTMRTSTAWQRDAIISEYQSIELEDIAVAGRKGVLEYGWWSRFNYAPIQAVLIRHYDNGFDGDTYELIPWFFLPRFLFPEKPAIDAGPRVTAAVFNRQTQLGDSSTGPTVFGEAYWNGGWLYLIGSSIIYGLLLAIVTYCCLWAITQGKVYSIVIAIMGLIYGGAINEFFSGSVVGSFVIFIGLFGILIVFLSRRISIFGRASLSG